MLQGSAAFWHNLDRDGNEDYNSLHGGCPVLLGQKWGKPRQYPFDRTLLTVYKYICTNVMPNDMLKSELRPHGLMSRNLFPLQFLTSGSDPKVK